MKTVMVFGVFDGIHPGHDNCLSQARTLGRQLVAMVARDKVIEQLKGRVPEHDQETRLEAVRQHVNVDHAELGDLIIGSFTSIYRLKPDVIALGYDQTALSKKLHQWMKTHKLPIEIVTLKSHKPEKYKSALLRDRQA
jgi:FAD synthetase